MGYLFPTLEMIFTDSMGPRDIARERTMSIWRTALALLNNRT